MCQSVARRCRRSCGLKSGRFMVAGDAGKRPVTYDLHPLTERLLSRLPGPRVLWIVLSALVPAMNAGANVLLGTGGTSAVWEQNDLLVILNYAALSLAMLITLWGTSRIAGRLETLSPAFGADARERFGAMNSVRGPVVLALVTAVAFGVALERDGWTAAFLRGVTWLILGIAIWTFLWTYASLQLGLDSLGREDLPSGPSVDPSLGLCPLGDVAFMGLWMLLVWLVPVVLTGLPDVPGVVIGLLVLAGGVGGSSYRLSGCTGRWSKSRTRNSRLRGRSTLRRLSRYGPRLRSKYSNDSTDSSAPPKRSKSERTRFTNGRSMKALSRV
jgi:hypothetical protein